MKIKKLILEFGESSIVSLVIVLVLYMFIASVEVVWGASMEPTFDSGDRILVDKISMKVRPLKRGEVVVFFPPTDQKKHFIKRVIGIPGDIFKIIGCGVVISEDGVKYELEEGYLKQGTCTTGGTYIKEGRALKIPDHEYALLGDNRRDSLDSRYLGFISEKKIVGRVVFRFWPITKIGFVD